MQPRTDKGVQISWGKTLSAPVHRGALQANGRYTMMRQDRPRDGDLSSIETCPHAKWTRTRKHLDTIGSTLYNQAYTKTSHTTSSERGASCP